MKSWGGCTGQGEFFDITLFCVPRPPVGTYRNCSGAIPSVLIVLRPLAGCRTQLAASKQSKRRVLRLSSCDKYQLGCAAPSWRPQNRPNGGYCTPKLVLNATSWYLSQLLRCNTLRLVCFEAASWAPHPPIGIRPSRGPQPLYSVLTFLLQS